MAVQLSVSVNESSTIVVTAAFRDEEGTAITPNSITYTLMDSGGTVVNEKEDEVVAPAESIDMVFYGDDLKLSDAGNLSSDPVRRVLVETTYDSTYGVDLPSKAECQFSIVDLLGV
jgi:hypothetical protein